MEAVEIPYSGLSVLLMEILVQWISTAVMHKGWIIEKNRIMRLYRESSLFSAPLSDFKCVAKCPGRVNSKLARLWETV